MPWARRGDPIPDPDRLWHVALVPTYTEPYHLLERTVQAIVDTDIPANGAGDAGDIDPRPHY